MLQGLLGSSPTLTFRGEAVNEEGGGGGGEVLTKGLKELSGEDE